MDELKKMNFQLAHVGINCNSSDEAKETASAICTLFGLDLIEAAPSFFAGTAVECMKQGGYGHNGHIGFSTDDMPLAMSYLASKGYEFIEESKKLNPDGSVKLIYLKNEIAGFAIHLVAKE